ncbi:MAG: hypothetical protein A3D92_16255 [Bacteroidetes bacterium RIFCSPHIGHO2_02_FULL_44_7]|nr:MAG: hypothetical protein A3D92_16255 [Bacteroidetes bacterium RIFCSPHIGHO2_02_FULL_44_7]
MKTCLFLLGLFATALSFGQDTTAVASDSVQKPWKLQSTFGLNGTQSSFVNWSAGGRNNITLMAYIEAGANYEKNNWKWNSNLGLALGGLQYIDKGSKERLQKTDDKIDVATSIGHRLKDSWFIALNGGFRTQFLDGFNFPNDSVRVSTFMAPGYTSLSLGIDFSPNENLTVFLSPISSKMTFVRDQTLADAGSYGVEGATYDETTGDVLTRGKMFRSEVGAYFKFMYNATLAKNIEMKSKLELFSNYLDHPENIDINAEILFNFKVNSWFSASLNWNLIYDDDIDIRDSKGNVGPRTQFKSVIGLGISYTLKNHKD